MYFDYIQCLFSRSSSPDIPPPSIFMCPAPFYNLVFSVRAATVCKDVRPFSGTTLDSNEKFLFLFQQLSTDSGSSPRGGVYRSLSPICIKTLTDLILSE